MQRCLDLAALGMGNVSPNPMVGAVIVHHDKSNRRGLPSTIWPGTCRGKRGKPGALSNFDDAEDLLLKQSTIYVSLEPCAHYGKTPPCADLHHQISHP
jgi:diaminohydroxyphosphoribosylaminopyrimidine deaminase/5-amino-6-(5-phosphoribosylamino)uracil reductase